MMTNLDTILGQMRAAPAPDMLDSIEGRVLAGVAQRREQALARRGMVLAGVLAMAIGVSGSLLPSAEARAEPLFGVPAAAPSRLLGE